MSDVQLRFAAHEDVALVLTFIRELADYERMSDEVVATEDGLRDALFGAHPAAEVIFAEIDSAPVGFALFFHNFSTFAGHRGIYLEDLFVRPEWRGRGVGLVLLGRLASLALERDCGRVEWAVLNWNEPAIGFYNRLGAKPMTEWTVYRLDGDALRRLGAR